MDILDNIHDNKIITLVGSRHISTQSLRDMSAIIQDCTHNGNIIRSGNGRGFEQIIGDIPIECREVYLPHSRFGRPLENRTNVYVPRLAFDNYQQAKDIVTGLYPTTQITARQMQYLARNVYCVLGADLKSPCNVVLCWNKDAEDNRDIFMITKLANQLAIPVVHIQPTHEKESL